MITILIIIVDEEGFLVAALSTKQCMQSGALANYPKLENIITRFCGKIDFYPLSPRWSVITDQSGVGP